jgi:DUF1680 family protein
MSLLHGDAKYIDVLERVIYNGFLSGISLSGNKFFYPNPLASEGKYQRSPWFGCACCPTNIVRFMPSLPGYTYAQKDNDVYVNLFIAGSAEVKVGQNNVGLQQETRYPWDGDIRVIVEPEHSEQFTVCVRIPGWAQNRPVPSDLYNYLDANQGQVSLKVNGNPVAVNIVKGYARIHRMWGKGDIIELNLPMPIRRVAAYPKVKDNRGRTAVERGPVVYCFEGADNPRGVTNLILPVDTKLQTEYHGDLLGGIVTISGRGQIRRDGNKTKDIDVVAIPYYAWAHRGKNEMAVWIPKSAEVGN